MARKLETEQQSEVEWEEAGGCSGEGAAAAPQGGVSQPLGGSKDSGTTGDATVIEAWQDATTNGSGGAGSDTGGTPSKAVVLNGNDTTGSDTGGTPSKAVVLNGNDTTGASGDVKLSEGEPTTSGQPLSDSKVGRSLGNSKKKDKRRASPPGLTNGNITEEGAVLEAFDASCGGVDAGTAADVADTSVACLVGAQELSQASCVSSTGGGQATAEEGVGVEGAASVSSNNTAGEDTHEGSVLGGIDVCNVTDTSLEGVLGDVIEDAGVAIDLDGSSVAYNLTLTEDDEKEEEGVEPKCEGREENTMNTVRFAGETQESVNGERVSSEGDRRSCLGDRVSGAAQDGDVQQRILMAGGGDKKRDGRVSFHGFDIIASSLPCEVVKRKNIYSPVLGSFKGCRKEDMPVLDSDGGTVKVGAVVSDLVVADKCATPVLRTDTSTDRKEENNIDRKQKNSTDRKEENSTDRKDENSTDRKQKNSTDRKRKNSTVRKEEISTDRKEVINTEKKDENGHSAGVDGAPPRGDEGQSEQMEKEQSLEAAAIGSKVKKNRILKNLESNLSPKFSPDTQTIIEQTRKGKETNRVLRRSLAAPKTPVSTTLLPAPPALPNVASPAPGEAASKLTSADAVCVAESVKPLTEFSVHLSSSDVTMKDLSIVMERATQLFTSLPNGDATVASFGNAAALPVVAFTSKSQPEQKVAGNLLGSKDGPAAPVKQAASPVVAATSSAVSLSTEATVNLAAETGVAADLGSPASVTLDHSNEASVGAAVSNLVNVSTHSTVPAGVISDTAAPSNSVATEQSSKLSAAADPSIPAIISTDTSVPVCIGNGDHHIQASVFSDVHVQASVISDDHVQASVISDDHVQTSVLSDDHVQASVLGDSVDSACTALNSDVLHSTTRSNTEEALTPASAAVVLSSVTPRSSARIHKRASISYSGVTQQVKRSVCEPPALSQGPEGVKALRPANLERHDADGAGQGVRTRRSLGSVSSAFLHSGPKVVNAGRKAGSGVKSNTASPASGGSCGDVSSNAAAPVQAVADVPVSSPFKGVGSPRKCVAVSPKQHAAFVTGGTSETSACASLPVTSSTAVTSYSTPRSTRAATKHEQEESGKSLRKRARSSSRLSTSLDKEPVKSAKGIKILKIQKPETDSPSDVEKTDAGNLITRKNLLKKVGSAVANEESVKEDCPKITNNKKLLQKPKQKQDVGVGNKADHLVGRSISPMTSTPKMVNREALELVKQSPTIIDEVHQRMQEIQKMVDQLDQYHKLVHHNLQVNDKVQVEPTCGGNLVNKVSSASSSSLGTGGRLEDPEQTTLSCATQGASASGTRSSHSFTHSQSASASEPSASQGLKMKITNIKLQSPAALSVSTLNSRLASTVNSKLVSKVFVSHSTQTPPVPLSPSPAGVAAQSSKAASGAVLHLPTRKIIPYRPSPAKSGSSLAKGGKAGAAGEPIYQRCVECLRNGVYNVTSCVFCDTCDVSLCVVPCFRAYHLLGKRQQ